MQAPPGGVVTFLFTDIEGCSRLWEEHPDAMRLALAQHDGLLRACIESQGGRVFKTVGDAFCAAFATAPDAAGAVLDIQHSLLADEATAGEPIPLKVRAVLHTGTAARRAGDYFGPTLNRAARLLAAAHGGQVLLSSTAREAAGTSLPDGATLRDRGRHRLKDLQQPEQIFQLVHPGLPSEFPPLRSLSTHPNNLPQQLTSFVGREREIADMTGLLGKTRLLTLTGAGAQQLGTPPTPWQ
jgi:class 3 adenylate cyclase